MEIKKVLLLAGGFSNEREVSLSSAQDIAKALQKSGYDVIMHDLQDCWQLLEVIKKEKPDVVFNGLYGNWGEDGTIQGLLDCLQIPYTHSGLNASAVGMNKYLTKLVAVQCGIKVARDEKITYGEFKQKGTSIKMPYVVKPVADGSSCGVYIVEKQDDLLNINYSHEDTELLIEEYIRGQELTTMCLQGKSYMVTELRSQAKFYDYRAKYTGGVTEHILPAPITDEVKQLCLDYATKLHKALGCNTISRSDFRYNPQDGVVMLEINTNPGMTSLSLVPEQAQYALSMSYDQLCDLLVRNAKCRRLTQ